MTLAQAIRAGSLLHRQGTRRLFAECEIDTEDGRTTEVLTCALGAAYEGFFYILPDVGLADEEDAYMRLTEAFPELKKDVTYPGVLYSPYARWPKRPPTLESAIIALNDEEDWTREQIADWVESLGY